MLTKIDWISPETEALDGPEQRKPDWRTIAEQATNEMDPKNLTTLISQLCAAIDQREASLAACRSQVAA
jgi:hypothetical protein